MDLTPELNGVSVLGEKFCFVSTFKPSTIGEQILKEGNILSLNETPQKMMERMVSSLFDVEKDFNTTPREIQKLESEFGYLLDNKYCVMSTPIMTNAGRYDNKPLSACTVPLLDFKTRSDVRNIIDHFHSDGMGTGFNLNEAADPVELLHFLNHIAVEGAKSGLEDRPVGNMAILSVYHPKILEFIKAKTQADVKGEEWKFNISVDIDDEFMRAVRKGRTYFLTNGEEMKARDILNLIVTCAHACGDPGLVFLDRLNRDNPTPSVGLYTSTAPCGEVGLAPGETCQFGYINVGKFLKIYSQDKKIDFQGLERATRLMTRALDNALEISIKRYFHPASKNIMQAKRKIGIGICGLADLLVDLGISYDSPEGRNMATDVIAFINYISKLESHELSKHRGSFGAMDLPSGNRYLESPSFLEIKYGNLNTRCVSQIMWRELAKNIQKTRFLRNASTMALPPTGRSGLVIDASTGIEPLFSLIDYGGTINQSLKKRLKEYSLDHKVILEAIRANGHLGGIDQIPDKIKEVYKTALEINPLEHLKMVEETQKAVDESISKTINIPKNATVGDVLKIYIIAYQMGLKGVTIFRTSSRQVQPRKLAQLPES